MAYRIEDILAWESLLGTITAQKDGIPDVLPPAFKTVTSETERDAGYYTVFYGQRKAAKVTAYGSPSVERELKSLGEKPVKLVHSHEKLRIDPKTYEKLRNYDNFNLQEKGVKELGRQMNLFARAFKNLEMVATLSMLANGKIWVDSSGNVLPTSSGAAQTIDYQVPSGNTGQLNVEGNGAIIGASWATASTDISAHIRNLKAASVRQTGYEITHAFYGVNIPSYIAGNNYAHDWWVRHPADREFWLENAEIPDGFMGIKKWIPVYKAFYEDDNGTNQVFFGADAITFTPDITEDVYEFMKGSYDVPTTFQPLANGLAALNSLKKVYGDFAYAIVTHDPVGVETHMGTTFLPIWKVPNALYVADVTP